MHARTARPSATKELEFEKSPQERLRSTLGWLPLWAVSWAQPLKSPLPATVLLILTGAEPEAEACPPVPAETPVPSSWAQRFQTSLTDMIYCLH